MLDDRNYHRREFSEDNLETLRELRIYEQVPWKGLPARYMDLLPEDNDETIPDWRTLRTAIMKDVASHILPARVHKKMRQRLVEEFDRLDLAAMLMSVLMARYGEWNVLYGRMLKHAANAGLPDDEREEGIEFSDSERRRMDALANEVLTTLIRVNEMMRQQSIMDSSLTRLVDEVNSGAEVIAGSVKEVQLSSDEAVKKLISSVKDTTADMLESIDNRHKERTMGVHRSYVEEEEDLIGDS